MIAGTAGDRRPWVLGTTGSLLLSPLEWVLEAFAEAGFTGVELLVAHDPATRDPQRVRAAAAQRGLAVPAVHGPYMLLLRNVLARDYVTKTRRALELSDELGAETMIAHAPLRWERRARHWLASAALPELGEQHSARFAMENLFPVAGRGLSTAILPADLAVFPHVVFDTSHFAVAGIDLFAAWDALAEQVVHLHVSDNFGNGRDSHAPIGSGVLPLEAFLAHVGRSGFAGTVTLELDCRTHLDTRETLVAFLRAQRELAEGLLAGEREPPAAAPAGQR